MVLRWCHRPWATERRCILHHDSACLSLSCSASASTAAIWRSHSKLRSCLAVKSATKAAVSTPGSRIAKASAEVRLFRVGGRMVRRMGGVVDVIDVLPCRRHGLTPREVRPRILRRSRSSWLRRQHNRSDTGLDVARILVLCCTRSVKSRPPKRPVSSDTMAAPPTPILPLLTA